MAQGVQSDAYACKCLNVRIKTLAPPAQTPVSVIGEYVPKYVGDEGIVVAHNQLTLRTRSRPVPPKDADSDVTRYVSLTCLICRSEVYRVLRTVPVDVAGVEGPLLPNEEYVEQETLRSSDGWVEMHSSCLSGKDIACAESSPNYSPIFSVVLSPDLLSSSTPSTPPLAQTPPSDEPPNPLEPITHLPPLRPLFPPPPFTPSHPAFTHLASFSTARSKALRADAEKRIAAQVQKEVDGLRNAEDELRLQTEALWRTFRRGLDNARARQGKARSPAHGPSGLSTSSGAFSPVAVRDFVPVASVSPSSVSRTSHARTHSALSASLSTSSFHHPRAAQLSPPTGVVPSRSLANGRRSVSGPIPAAAASLPPGLNGVGPDAEEDENAPLRNAFRRNLDQRLDAATSFRYESVLADEMLARAKKAREQEEASSTAQSNGEETDAANGKTQEKAVEKRPVESREDAKMKQDDAAATDEAKDTKGKRKVTFDVNPAVVTIKREITAENRAKEAEQAKKAATEMIFELEDEDDAAERTEMDEEATSLISPPLSPSAAKDPASTRPQAPRRTSSQRSKLDIAGLPQSLSSLRPASLPSSSVIRPPASPSRAQGLSSQPNLDEAGPSRRPRERQYDPVEASPDPREEEIMRLVAANTPSHRGAWNRDSKAWQMFVRRRGAHVTRWSDGGIPEEEEDNFDDDEPGGRRARYPDEDDSDQDSGFEGGDTFSPGLARSLPIAIGPLQTRHRLELPTYQPKTSLSDRPGLLVPPLQAGASSGAATRRAMYAQRDRLRALDPGALDFASADDEHGDDEGDGDEDGPQTGLVGTYAGERGRQRAFKILEARSKVPDPGMWRSLAS